MKHKISIVIPNYNGEELLRKNLPSVLKAFGNKENNISEVIVVDDGSRDKSVEILKRDFPEVRLIKHTKNRGFSSTVNTGVRASKGDLIALLNTDVSPSENFLVSIPPYFKDSKVFGVSMHEVGFGWSRGVFRNGFIAHEPGRADGNKHQTFWANGGSGVFRRDLWFEVGGLDEKILNPYYWEDIDICYRAQKMGYLIYWDPNSLVEHKHESTIRKISIRKRETIQERNQLLFIWKNLTSPRMIRKHIVGLFSRLLHHPGYIKIVIIAMLRLPAVYKSKKRTRKQQKVSDEAIFQVFK